MKTEPISFRADPETKRRWKRAAKLEHRTLTSFIIAAAEERAARIAEEAEGKGRK